MVWGQTPIVRQDAGRCVIRCVCLAEKKTEDTQHHQQLGSTYGWIFARRALMRAKDDAISAIWFSVENVNINLKIARADEERLCKMNVTDWEER